MRRNLLVPVAIALVGGMALAGVFVLPGSAPPAAPPSPINPLVRPTPSPSAFSWKLTAAMSEHRGMVLEVETTRPAEAMAIAQQLTAPYQDRFDEVLVFFFEPHANPRRAAVRVQWTRAHGYRTLILRSSP